MTPKTILITGGAGYIGSHTCLELVLAGHNVIVVDNLKNSSRESLRRIEQQTGRAITFYEADILDAAALAGIFASHPDIYAVFHFAGLKVASESIRDPLRYYEVNTGGTLALLRCMDAANIKRILFSSSSTVYGSAAGPVVAETSATAPINPYGGSKLASEHIIQDLCRADPAWQAMLLRYFNPIGAHPSGIIGDAPLGVPSSLTPYILQVIGGKLERLHVFGGNYNTKDGTGFRDYIHVVDVARGHLAALDKLAGQRGCEIYNLGAGTGYSVLDIVQAMERASNCKIPYAIADRRPGDIGELVSDSTKAARELDWRAHLDLDDMCRDLWHWSRKNPDGYTG
ncbi:UDP-glucose 4-epimerase [Syncephalis pseudoplumigaleata]|uniref:UDP-glucose 4-epimerase n=1 Tax=Syncephalis pseudoplumigaleata TaxID=1712513 RepID=A0A4P9Z664_9FUNG|nr:UDP-glucose 4-epimerase [Syncephalis pseudoplumigaleata]|eukprot:RKP27321.1 UDP-glucose 4-epimerase [Syncephalis pseudoplumigaleata]